MTIIDERKGLHPIALGGAPARLDTAWPAGYGVRWRWRMTTRIAGLYIAGLYDDGFARIEADRTVGFVPAGVVFSVANSFFA